MTKKYKYNGFVKVGKIFEHEENRKDFHAALLRYRTLKSWEEVAGGFVEDAHRLTKATAFNHGVLVIACLSKEIAYQIKVLAARIAEALNKVLGSVVVRKIEVQF